MTTGERSALDCEQADDRDACRAGSAGEAVPFTQPAGRQGYEEDSGRDSHQAIRPGWMSTAPLTS
jgi:hypothetical protein